MPDDALPAWNLVQTAHLVGLRFGELFAAVDLTPTQFAVLMHLDGPDGGETLTRAELARRVLVRPQSAAALVESLVERGLVTREGPGGRGRRAGIAITEAGRAVLECAWPPVRAFNAPAALGLTVAQAAMLDEILGLVRSALETVD